MSDNVLYRSLPGLVGRECNVGIIATPRLGSFVRSVEDQERKRLLRMAIESVQLDGVSKAEEIDVQIRWRSGVLTNFAVKRVAPGESSLKTPPEAVAMIHEMAGQCSYGDIALRLNDAGYRTAFGRPFTHQHVGYICRRDGQAAGHERHQSQESGTPKRPFVC